MHKWLSQNPWKPLLNRSIMGQYPPGSTFKTSQALTYLTEESSLRAQPSHVIMVSLTKVCMWDVMATRRLLRW